MSDKTPLNQYFYLPEVPYQDNTGIDWENNLERYRCDVDGVSQLCISTTKEGLQIPLLLDDYQRPLPKTFGLMTDFALPLKDNYLMTLWNGPTEKFPNSFGSNIRCTRVLDESIAEIASYTNPGTRDISWSYTLSSGHDKSSVYIGTLELSAQKRKTLKTNIIFENTQNKSRLVFSFNNHGYLSDVTRFIKPFGIYSVDEQDQSDPENAAHQIRAETISAFAGETIDIDDPQIRADYCRDYLGVVLNNTELRIDHLATMKNLITNINLSDDEVIESPVSLINYDDALIKTRTFFI